MEKEKTKVSVEQVMSSTEVLRYLEELVQGFKTGKITLTHGVESVDLAVPQSMDVEIEAKQKKEKCKFVMELSWRVRPSILGDGAEPESDPCDLPSMESTVQSEDLGGDVKSSEDKSSEPKKYGKR